MPEHRFLPYPAAFEGRYRTEFTDEAVYRAALVPITVLILIGSQLGIARAALDHTIAYASKRGVTHTNYHKQRESTGFQILIADAAMKIETANLHAFRAADDLDRASQSGRHPDLTERARVRTDTALVAKYCREAVERSSPPTARRASRTRTYAALVARRARRQPSRDHRVLAISRYTAALRHRAEHAAHLMGRSKGYGGRNLLRHHPITQSFAYPIALSGTVPACGGKVQRHQRGPVNRANRAACSPAP